MFSTASPAATAVYFRAQPRPLSIGYSCEALLQFAFGTRFGFFPQISLAY